MATRTKKKPAPPPYDPHKAKSYIDRVRRVMEDRKVLSEDISEICGEAKSDGLEPTFIRFAAREGMIDTAERNARDEKRAMYLHAVGLAVEAALSGEMSAREAAKVYGVGKSNVYKLMAVHAMSTHRDMVDGDIGEWLPTHDAETGELPREMTADDLGDPVLLTDPPRAQFRAQVRAIAATLTPIVPEPVKPAVVEDDLEIPEGLRREIPERLRRTA
jgi:uncharacterized protein (UPF0335 family)